MNVSFRPHTIRYSNTTQGYFDNDGVWINPTASELSDEIIPCRAEPNGRATTIALPDGRMYTYAYVVYLDRNVRAFTFGENIQIANSDGTILVKGKEVQGFHRGQLNSKLWL